MPWWLKISGRSGRHGIGRPLKPPTMTKHKRKLEDPPPTADNKRTKKEEGAAEDRPVGGMINIVGAPVGFAFGPVLKSQHAEAHGWSQARLDEVDRSK